MEELFEIVNENNEVIGTALRSECHGNPNLCHRTAHVIVLNNNGDMLLQKRAVSKDIQPGKWDTAVGGHLALGETFEQAAVREMNEELGISEDQSLTFLFYMKIRNKIESENVAVFSTVYNGPFKIQKSEIDEIKFWTITELKNKMNKNFFTPNCILEIDKFLKHMRI